MEKNTPNANDKMMAGDDRIESLRDLLPALRELHATQNTPDLFKAWLEDLIEAKTHKH